ICSGSNLDFLLEPILSASRFLLDRVYSDGAARRMDAWVLVPPGRVPSPPQARQCRRMARRDICQSVDVRTGPALDRLFCKFQRIDYSTGVVAGPGAVVLSTCTAVVACVRPHAMDHCRGKRCLAADPHCILSALFPLAAAILSRRNHVFRARDAVVSALE